MIDKLNNRGFTLAEVLISTIVMSMIMGSVLAFVQYAGDIWHKGNEKISTDNYSRMAFEYIKQELLEAKTINSPAKKEKQEDYPTNAVEILYEKKVNNLVYPCSIKVSDFILERNINFTTSSSDKIRIARNVANFHVKRTSNTMLEVSIQIKKEQNEDELEYEDGNPVYEIVSSDTMVLLAPGVD